MFSFFLLRRARPERAVRRGGCGGRAARAARELAARGGRGPSVRLLRGYTLARASGPSPFSLALTRSAAARVEAPQMSGQMNSARERGIRRGAQIGPPALPSCRRVRILCERDPLWQCPCPAPSPRRDAPSPLAFAKSCKGGDVSVLDPALAWDVRFIYLFMHPLFGVSVLFIYLFIAERAKRLGMRPQKRRARRGGDSEN